uniref:Polyprotein n=1 Tax=Insectivora picornavirus TaxID=3039002 RepID=A0AAT9TXX8_9PICO|nr:MAG: polyprotein [Insectivora picornavirus]
MIEDVRYTKTQNSIILSKTNMNNKKQQLNNNTWIDPRKNKSNKIKSFFELENNKKWKTIVPKRLHSIVESIYRKKITMTGPFPRIFYGQDLDVYYFLNGTGGINEELFDLYQWFRHPDPDYKYFKAKILRAIRLYQKTESFTPEEAFQREYRNRQSSIEEYFGYSIDRVCQAPWPCYCPKFKINGILYFIPPWMEYTLEEAKKIQKDKVVFPRMPYIDFVTGRRIKRGRAFIIQGERKEELYALPHSYYGVSWGDDGELAYSYDADRFNLSRASFQSKFSDYAINRQTDDMEYIDEELRDATDPDGIKKFQEEYWAPNISKYFDSMSFRDAFQYSDPTDYESPKEFHFINRGELPKAQSKQLDNWAALQDDSETLKSEEINKSDPLPVKSILKKEKKITDTKSDPLHKGDKILKKNTVIDASDTDSEKLQRRTIFNFKKDPKVRDFFKRESQNLGVSSYKELYDYLITVYGEPKLPEDTSIDLTIENSELPTLSDDQISLYSQESASNDDPTIEEQVLELEFDEEDAEVRQDTPSTIVLEGDLPPLAPPVDESIEIVDEAKDSHEPLMDMSGMKVARIFLQHSHQCVSDTQEILDIAKDVPTEIEEGQAKIIELPCVCQVPLKQKTTPGRSNNCLLYALLQGKYHVSMAGFDNDLNPYRKAIERWTNKHYPKATGLDFTLNAMLSQNEMKYAAEFFKISVCFHYFKNGREYMHLMYNTQYENAQIVHVRLENYHYSTLELTKPKIQVPLEMRDAFVISQFPDTIAMLDDSDDQSLMSKAFEEAKDDIDQMQTSITESLLDEDERNQDVRLYSARQIQSISELIIQAEQKFKNVDANKLKEMKITAPESWERMAITSNTGYSIQLIADPMFTKHASFRDMLYDQSEKRYLSLYHFLRLNRAKRYYNRMRELYGIPNWIFTIIFPGNVKGSAKYANDERCEFCCRSFHQDCQWHSVIPNEDYDQAFVDKLIQRRKALAHALKPEYDNACFWISLQPEVNSQRFQMYQRYGGFAKLNDLPENTLVKAQSTIHSCTKCDKIYRFNIQYQNHLHNDHNVPIKSSSMDNVHNCTECNVQFMDQKSLEEHHIKAHTSDEATSNLTINRKRIPRRKQQVDMSTDTDELVEKINAASDSAHKTAEPQEFMHFQCPSCQVRVYGPRAYHDHIQRCVPKMPMPNPTKDKSGLMAKIMEFIKSQLNMIMEAMVSVWNSFKGCAKRFRRIIVNIAIALVHLVMNPNPLTISTFVITLTNELASEVSDAEMKYVDSVKSSLTQVITSRTCAAAQAMPSQADDQAVAEESYTTSMLHILGALLPWAKPNAMLLKARQAKIESMVRSMSHIKDFGKWILEWLKKLWAMIQVYFFGASLEDYKHVLSTLDADEVHKWIQEVHAFEMRIDTVGGLESIVANMVNDASLHLKLYEMRDKGLKYAETLVRLKDADQRQLYQMVNQTNSKIQKWVDRITPRLLKQIPKHSPFCVYIWGDPGVGKSVMVDPMASFFSSLTSRKYDPVVDKFCKSPTAEFWEGYNQQRVVVFDDMLQAKDQEMNIREVGGIIHAASRAACHLNMATLEDKSSSYFTSEFIFITSNVAPTKEVIEAYVESFGAFARRFDMVLRARRGSEPANSAVFDPSIYQFQIQRWQQYSCKDSKGNEGEFKNVTNPYIGGEVFTWDHLLGVATKFYAEKVKKEHELDKMKNVSFASPVLNKYFKDTVGESLREAFPKIYEEEIIPEPDQEKGGSGEVVDKDQTIIFALEQMDFKKCPACTCKFEAYTRRQRFADWIQHNIAMVSSKFLALQHVSAMLTVRGFFLETKTTLKDFIKQEQGQEGLSDVHLKVLEECNWSHNIYSPPGCPFTFAALEEGEFYEAQAYVLDFVMAHDIKESYTKWFFMSPIRTLNAARQKIASKLGFIDDWKNAPRKVVGIAERVAEHTKEEVTKAVESLKKSHDTIANAVVIGTVIMLLVAGLTMAMHYSKKSKFLDSLLEDAKTKQSIMQPEVVISTIESAEEENTQEGWGGSGSNMTKTAAKKMRQMVKAHNRIIKALVEQGVIRGKIEASDGDEVFIEEGQDICLNVISNGITFIPSSFGDYKFRRCPLGQIPQVSISRRTINNESEVLIEDITGVKSVARFALKVPQNEIQQMLQDHFSRAAESKQDREDLVRYLSISQNGLPRAQASMDPNANQCMISAIRSIFVVWNLNNTRRVNGFFIKGNTMVVPRHLFDCDEDIPRTTLLISTTQIGGIEIFVGKCKYIVLPEKDMVIISHTTTAIPFRPNLVEKFIRTYDDFSDGDNGYLLVPVAPKPHSRIEVVRQLEVRNITFNQQVSYVGASTTQLFTTTGSVSYSADTEVGDCGGLLFRMNPSEPKKIMGFHVAGSTHGGYASLTPLEMWERRLQEIPQAQYAAEDLLEQLPYEQNIFDMKVQKEGNNFEFQVNTRMAVLGLPEPRDLPSAPRQTRIVASPIQGMLQPPLSKPAHLRPFINSQGKEIDPLRLALSKLEADQIILPQDVVDLAIEAMRASYSALPFKPEMYGNKGLLTKHEAINGISGHKWIRPMNMKTSPGYPFCLAGGKEVCLEDLDNGEKKMRDYFEKMVDRRIAAGLKGQALPALVIDCMKDERLPNDKVDAGKVRIFNIKPMDANVVSRIYFLKFLAHMMDNHVIGEVSVGLNPHGQNWKALYRRLKASGDHWLAGDYSAWDKRVPYQCAIGALGVVEDFYRRFPDYCEEHQVIRKVLVDQDFAGVRLAIGEQSVMYQVHQSMPSGTPLTAVYNSLVNALLYRVIFILLMTEKAGWSKVKAANAYKTHVHFVAYGDDHIVRVSDIVFPYFNMVTISQKMKEFGIGYTAPDKSDKMPMELRDEELTYLKRSFVERYNGDMDAPMRLESVIDILSWVHSSGKSQREINEALKMAARSTFIELSHHTGEEYFEWYSKILTAMIQKGIQPDVLSYEEARRIRQEESFSYETLLDFWQ